jgi:hypothetical protein
VIFLDTRFISWMIIIGIFSVTLAGIFDYFMGTLNISNCIGALTTWFVLVLIYDHVKHKRE